MGKTSEAPRARPMKGTGKRYTSVAAMVRATVDDPGFADEFEQRSADRRLVRALAALRASQQLTQAEIALRMGCTQAKVSKLESSDDADLSVGDVLAYARAVGHNVRIVIGPSSGLQVEIQGAPDGEQNATLPRRVRKAREAGTGAV